MGFQKARSAAVLSPSPGADHKSSALCLNAGNWFKSFLRMPFNGARQACTPETMMLLREKNKTHPGFQFSPTLIRWLP